MRKNPDRKIVSGFEGFLLEEKSIHEENVKKNGETPRRKEAIERIDKLLSNDGLIKKIDGFLWVDERHHWIIFGALTDLERFHTLGVSEKKYSEYKRSKMKKFEEVKRFLDIDLGEREIGLVFPKSPSEIRNELFRILRDLKYDSWMIKELMAAIGLQKRNRPRNFKERPPNVHIFTQASRVLP